MSEQHDNIEQATIKMLHQDILQTGADVRALGAKLDLFTTSQNSIYTTHAVEMARLKSVDESQQQDINDLKAAPDKHRSNKLAVWGLIIGGLGFFGCVLQAVVTFLHR